MDKPFSQACENNKQAIFEVLRQELARAGKVLEVGSGTGQHAVYFATRLAHLIWQTSDLPAAHAGIEQWLDEAALQNTPRVVALDVLDYPWGEVLYDAVFTANTLHIMSLDAARKFVTSVAAGLNQGGRFIVYGAFNYGGEFTSESNARFDYWLRQQNRESGLRDFEMIDGCAQAGGLALDRDYPMPANNRLIVWRKPAHD